MVRDYQLESLEPRMLFSVVSGFEQSILATGLSHATQMAFAPDGRLFVSEQAGEIRVIQDGRLLPTPFVTLPTRFHSDKGVFGIAFDPHFASNHYVYVYWTDESPDEHFVISRLTADGNVAVPGSRKDIFSLPALSPTEEHNGGALAFGPDGKLYVGVGDGGIPLNAQSLNNPFGKMLRINPDGSIPTDDPFYSKTTGINRAIWALGLRNPYTFAFQPGTGKLFINDVGNNTWEEVDEGIAGANYGWPYTEGDIQPDQTRPSNYHDPVYEYDHGVNESNGVAISGGAFYDPSAGLSKEFPSSFDGDYFYADYGKGYIKYFNSSHIGAAATFATGLTNVLNLQVGPDGCLYALEYGANGNGEVIRFLRVG